MKGSNEHTFGWVVPSRGKIGLNEQTKLSFTRRKANVLAPVFSNCQKTLELLSPHVNSLTNVGWKMPEQIPLDFLHQPSQSAVMEQLIPFFRSWQRLNSINFSDPDALRNLRYERPFVIEGGGKIVHGPIVPPNKVGGWGFCDGLVSRLVSKAEGYLTAVQADNQEIAALLADVNNLLQSASQATDPNQEQIDSAQALTDIWEINALQNDAAVQQQNADAILANLGSYVLPCDFGPVENVVQQVDQIAQYLNGQGDSCINLVLAFYYAYANQLMGDAAAKLANIDTTAAQQVAQCMQIVRQWYGVDLVLDETCTKALEAELRNWLGAPSIFDLFAIIGAGIATGLAAAGVGSLVTGLVALIISLLRGEADLFQIAIGTQDMTRHNGITMHFSVVPVGVVLASEILSGGVLGVEVAQQMAEAEQGMLAAESIKPLSFSFVTPFVSLFWISGN